MALRVTIQGDSQEAMGELVLKHEVDVVRSTVRSREDGGYAVDAVVSPERLARLTAAGYAVDVIEDADEIAAARRGEIEWHPDDLAGRVRPRGPIE